MKKRLHQKVITSKNSSVFLLKTKYEISNKERRLWSPHSYATNFKSLTQIEIAICCVIRQQIIYVLEKGGKLESIKDRGK